MEVSGAGFVGMSVCHIAPLSLREALFQGRINAVTGAKFKITVSYIGVMGILQAKYFRIRIRAKRSTSPMVALRGKIRGAWETPWRLGHP